ncbi:MAG TPA: hypothetical protein VH157_14215 [Bryobacteraceae bacterium]|jgi:DUF4097 and DUF4098 domain-containing protein YvlB|nr:hypothetical protein [Bryobacteraceae bacterium]
MKQFVSISVAFGLGIVPLAVAQSESPITREGRYWVRTFTGSINARAMERLRLDTVGSVVLRGEAQDIAVYKLKARVRAVDARDAEALLRLFDIRTRTQGPWGYLTVAPSRRISEAPELSLTVPRGLRQIMVETRGGDVHASNLDGEIEARSAGGQINVDGIKGRCELRTGGGDIEVGSVGGSVRCYSGGGIIRVQSAGGESWFETAGGEIFVHQAMGPVHAATAGGNIRVDRALSTVFARTAAGLIQVQQADGAVTAESYGGAIQVNSANGVRCDSAGGPIRLRNVGGPLRASTAAGSILAELLSGNRIENSTLSTNAGDITVFIASNLPLTVAARNESMGALGRIISDFPEIQVKSVTQPGTNPVVAEGALNGGGPVLHINVVGGTIYLRRQK